MKNKNACLISHSHTNMKQLLYTFMNGIKRRMYRIKDAVVKNNYFPSFE